MTGKALWLVFSWQSQLSSGNAHKRHHFIFSFDAV
jgi:hypothetical protein